MIGKIGINEHSGANSDGRISIYAKHVPDRMDMREGERVQDGMFSHVSLELRVPVDHPMRSTAPIAAQMIASLGIDRRV
jgi:hypothetical protein